MKTLIVALLCSFLVGFCSCGRTEMEIPSTTATAMSSADEATLPTIEATTHTTTARPKVDLLIDKEDPYSYIVKERYEKLLSQSIEFNRDIVKDHYFALHDIDVNGEQDLLISEKWGGEIYLIAIYSVQNGVAVHQEEYKLDFAHDRPHLFKNGTIKIVGDGGDFPRVLTYL